MTSPADVTVRRGRADEGVQVRRVLDGAMLETDGVGQALERGDVLVAAAGNQVVGALVLLPLDDESVRIPAPVDARLGAVAGPEPQGMHVDAIAVTRRRRDAGIGRTLARTALDRAGLLTVAFEDDVREFYEALDFELVEADGRWWGIRAHADGSG